MSIYNPLHLFSRLCSCFTTDEQQTLSKDGTKEQTGIFKRNTSSVDTLSSAAAQTHGMAPAIGADKLIAAEQCSATTQTFACYPPAPSKTVLTKEMSADLASHGISVKPMQIDLPTATTIAENSVINSYSKASETTQLALDETAKQAAAKSTSSESLLNNRIEILSKKIDEELEKKDVNFERLQSMVYMLVMLLMRRSAKTDHEFITEMGNQIKSLSVQIQGTYNTWPTLLVTVVSAGVSIAGGFMGIAPLAPTSFIGAETAKALAQNAQAVTNAGTGLQSLASLGSNRSEAQRQGFQTQQQRTTGKEEDRKGAKQTHGQGVKDAKESLKGAAQAEHDSIRTILGQ